MSPGMSELRYESNSTAKMLRFGSLKLSSHKDPPASVVSKAMTLESTENMKSMPLPHKAELFRRVVYENVKDVLKEAAVADALSTMYTGCLNTTLLQSPWSICPPEVASCQFIVKF